MREALFSSHLPQKQGIAWILFQFELSPLKLPRIFTMSINFIDESIKTVTIKLFDKSVSKFPCYYMLSNYSSGRYCTTIRPLNTSSKWLLCFNIHAHQWFIECWNRFHDSSYY